MATLDHVAIQVADLDAFLAEVTTSSLLRILRRGTRTGTGQRLVMLVDDSGHKLEVVEGTATGLLHLGFEVPDADDAHRHLVESGLDSTRPPRRIDAAKSTSGMVSGTSGVELQLLTYDADSPDRT